MTVIGRLVKRTALTLVLVFPQLSFGWGQDGHKIVALVGSKLALQGTQFWDANSANMVNMTNVPDYKWKAGGLSKLETVTHYFQPDSYYKDPKQFAKISQDFGALSALVGTQNAIEYGSTPWRINQFYVMALNALKKQDFKTAVMIAGVMSHYIGDLSQPLHVTENYDGQMTNNKGIHKYFETTIIQPRAQELVPLVKAATEKLLKNPNFLKQIGTNVVDASFNETFRSYTFKNKLIEIDLKLGRKGEGEKQQLELAIERLADGAATLAVILSKLWQDSGLKDVGATGAIDVPEWIKPNYYSNESLLDSIEMKTRRLLLEDDCGL